MALKPEHAKLSAYFNSDNGAGRVRGIWLQGNTAVRADLRAWMQPLADLGVVALGPRSVSSTDHVSFDAVGLPGFQFMVDRLEYNSRTHHSNMDVYDRVQRDDLVQQATVDRRLRLRRRDARRKVSPQAAAVRHDSPSPLNHHAVELARKRCRYPASSQDKMPAR